MDSDANEKRDHEPLPIRFVGTFSQAGIDAVARLLIDDWYRSQEGDEDRPESQSAEPTIG